MHDSIKKKHAFSAKSCEPVTLKPGTAYPPEFPDPIGGRVLRRLSQHAGLVNLAVVQVELPPGSALSLRLRQSHEEEFFYVLSGEATLITEDGEETLVAGDCVGFPPGGPDGHQFVNKSQATAVFLEIADIVEGNETDYSGLDLRAVTRAGQRIFVNRNGEPYARREEN